MLNHDKIILLWGCFTAWWYVKNLLLKDLANRVQCSFFFGVQSFRTFTLFPDYFNWSLRTKANQQEHLSHLVTKPTKWLCAQQRLRLAWASTQSGHPPSLIRVFAVRMTKDWVLSYPLSAQRRLWSDCTATNFDQTWQMPRLIWVFAGCTVILLVLSWGGSFDGKH